MVRSQPRMLTLTLCLAAASCTGMTSKEPVNDAKAIEGLWSGSWGGGERDGVVFQPAIAELFVKNTHVELHGFPNIDRLTGTVHVDTSAGQIRITPASEHGQHPPKAIHYAYGIKGDELTLIDDDEVPVTLQKVHVVQDPLASARVELVAADQINDAGELLVTEFRVLRVGQQGVQYFTPVTWSLKTKEAVVGIVQESGWRKVTVNEARGLIRGSTPVALMYRDDDRSSPRQVDRLWRETGSPTADSDVVWRTLTRVLRPGTLVFILAPPDLPPP